MKHHSAITKTVFALLMLIGCQSPMTVARPSSPTGVAVISGSAQATVSWTAASDANSYNLYYSTTSSVTTATGTMVPAVTSPYTLPGLTNGTTYYFIVTAVNAGGESAASSQASTIPLSTNADLSMITLTAGTLNPVFSSSTRNYSVQVDSSVSSVTIEGVRADPRASVSAPITIGHLAVGVSQNASITVTAEDGGVKTYVVAVTVPIIPAKGVTLSTSNLNLILEGPSETLSATLMPPNSTSMNLLWSSSDTAVASVGSNGEIRPISPGIANITVSTEDKRLSATCSLSVVSLKKQDPSKLTRSGPVKIMPLGDSITWGLCGTYSGYRGYLYDLLVQGGRSFSFVGSQIDATGGNEGHSGYTIAQIQDGIVNSNWLVSNPDIILLMVGTNNLRPLNVSSAQNQLSSLVQSILTRLPTVELYVAKIPPWGYDTSPLTYNSQVVPQVVYSFKIRGYDVSIVDNCTDFADGQGGISSDGIHPNDLGYKWIAESWLEHFNLP